MPTRSDLRDEFAMVDDLFAISPISARPAQPSEADYEAIRDAFMETSRGRWFLGEYAKRNRNADTSMVLDAVARIEQALAAQQRLQQQLEIQAADDRALPEALTAIRNAVTVAEGAAAATLDGLALEQNLAPIRKGVRIIREISWRWREIGADSRICDLIDSQVVAIEAACDQLFSADPRAALIAAFDVIRAELDSHGETTAAISPAADEIGIATAEPAQAPAPETASAPVGAEAIPTPAAAETSAPAVPVQASVAVTVASAATAKVEPAAPAAGVAAAPAPAKPAAEAVARAPVADDVSARAPVPVPPSKPVETAPKPAQASVEPVKAAAPPTQALGERAEVVDEIGPLTADDDDMDIIVVSKAEADAQDEALLDIVAAAMGAPEPAETKGYSSSSSIHFDIEDPGAVDDDIVATFIEPPAPAPQSEQPRIAAVPPAAPFQPAAAPAPTPVAVAPAPDPRSVPVASPKPSPVVPPPAPMALDPAPAMQEPAKPVLVVQDVPKPAPVVQEQPPRPAAALVVQEQPKPAATATLHPLPKPIPQPSLGATLLANGFLQRPVAANDPLTPIRRMTQPEKIAFFS